MKRVVRAASISEDVAMRHARKIKSLASQLFDALDNTPSGFVDNNDLGPLYDELAEVLPGLDLAIKTKTLEY